MGDEKGSSHLLGRGATFLGGAQYEGDISLVHQCVHDGVRDDFASQRMIGRSIRVCRPNRLGEVIGQHSLEPWIVRKSGQDEVMFEGCLLYTSDAADE